MTPPKPLNDFQSTLPEALPRHLRRRIVTNELGCWIASGAESHGKYQSVSINNKSVLAHRYSYRVLVGPIPDGLTLDHLCRVTWCVRPDHLEPVTIWENTLRGNAVSAQNARKTSCLRGHPLEGGNLYSRPDGNGRQCRECQRMHERKWKRDRAARRRGER